MVKWVFHTERIKCLWCKWHGFLSNAEQKQNKPVMSYQHWSCRSSDVPERPVAGELVRLAANLNERPGRTVGKQLVPLTSGSSPSGWLSRAAETCWWLWQLSCERWPLTPSVSWKATTFTANFSHLQNPGLAEGSRILNASCALCEIKENARGKQFHQQSHFLLCKLLIAH